MRRAVEVLSSESDTQRLSEGKSSTSSAGSKNSSDEFEVTIPAGLKAGEEIAVPLPSGKQHVLKIPANYNPSEPMDVVVTVKD